MVVAINSVKMRGKTVQTHKFFESIKVEKNTIKTIHRGLVIVLIAGISLLISEKAVAKSSSEKEFIHNMRLAAFCSGFLDSSGKNSIMKGRKFNDTKVLNSGNKMVKDGEILLMIAAGGLKTEVALELNKKGSNHNNDTDSKDHATAMECFKLTRQLKDEYKEIFDTVERPRK